MGDIKYKRAKLTFGQKELRKIMRKKAQELKREIKAKTPVESGALKHQIDYKVKAAGGYRVTVVVGVVFRGEWKGKIPTLYSIKIDEKTGFISDRLKKKDLEEIQRDIKEVIAFN